MSPTWAQIVAGGLKSSRSLTNVTQTPIPAKQPDRRACDPGRPDESAAINPERNDRQHQRSDINTNRKESLEIETTRPSNPPYKSVVMDQNDRDEPGSLLKPAATPERPYEAHQEKPKPQPKLTPMDAPTDAYVRIATEERKQIVDKVCSELLDDVRERIVDEYFRSPAVLNAMSPYICAEKLCQHQLPVRCIKGRWVTCEKCGNKTCVMSACRELQREHKEGGWEICPEGAAGMGLERIARERKWERCGRCHRFLLKPENDKTGKSLPCSHCASVEKAGE